ncbi:FIG067310: hypothetical protein [hydrothermal vent metagenome]|uniref:DUF1302 domain-containing protein n=1 Tax=hydrothermal vent metagenome TaxID=652676 RepID=A0A3B0W2Y8_9ZZZZ
MKNIKQNNLTRAIKLAVLTSSLGLASLASAISFNNGDFSASWDTTVSYGISLRAEERDESLIGFCNLEGDISNSCATPGGDRGRWSINSDNGNLNYDQWDKISNALKITSEFGFSYKSFGGFFRATSFYDFTNNSKDELSDTAKEFVGKNTRLLDAYIYKDFELGSHAGTVRFGRQVISWGESTFIQQGINVINPIDVSQIRVAGAELKEAYLPIDMIYGSIDITNNLSMEALYMFEFEQIDPDPDGTYFSSNDFATPGAQYVMLGFGTVPEQFPAATINRRNVAGASDNGQYGVSLKYFAPQINDTEFGLYYLNYHSRLPMISAVSLAPVTIENPTPSPSTGAYFIEYPEDIDLYGLSFNTVINSTGTSIAGELSYRPNVPLQIDDVEVLFAALSPLNPLIPAPYNRFVSQLGDFGPSEYIQGWERHKVSQFQVTATQLFGPNNPFKADEIVVLAEFGFTNVWDLPDTDVLRYNGPGTDTGGGASTATGGSGRNPVTEPNEYFATPFSWGYRLITRFSFNNAFGTPINLFPRLAYNHDVNGTTPGPGGNFLEDRKSVTLGLGAVYLEKWGADLSYTAFFGAGIRNLIGDRDYVSLNIKYSF